MIFWMLVHPHLSSFCPTHVELPTEATTGVLLQLTVLLLPSSKPAKSIKTIVKKHSVVSQDRQTPIYYFIHCTLVLSFNITSYPFWVGLGRESPSTV